MTDQYIITEELVEAVETALESDEHCKKCPYEGGGFKQGVASHLRSHPYNPQAEREKVLDKIWKYFTDNDCQVHTSPISGEKYYWISGTFSVSGLMRLVEELRQEGKDGE